MGVLKEIGRPDMLDVDGDRLYVTEGPSIYIYSKKDLKLIKKFGKAGEGPEEFNVNQFIRLNVRPGDLQVISLGKVSYFTKNGDFIKETRTSALNQRFQAVGDRFVGVSYTRENKINYIDLEGKFLGKAYLPFFKRNFLTYFPMTIRNDTLYQIIDNPDSEDWELHETPIFLNIRNVKSCVSNTRFLLYK